MLKKATSESVFQKESDAFQTENETADSDRVISSEPIVQISASSSSKPSEEAESKNSGPSEDSFERSRIEFVKDYLSRFALAQAIAKQMLSREVQEQPPAPTMESILEARWSLLSRAQLQQQLLNQAPLIQVPQVSILPSLPQVPLIPRVSTIEDLTRGIISENLTPKPTGQPKVSLPLSKPVLSATEVRKNELLASLAFLQPLPAKLPDVISKASNFAKPFSSPEALASDVFQKSESSNTSPTSKALRMFRRNPGGQNFKTLPSEMPEDLSSSAKKDPELKKLLNSENSIFSTFSSTPETQSIKPGTSLLKSNSPKKKDDLTVVPEKAVSESSTSPEKKPTRGRGGRGRRSLPESIVLETETNSVVQNSQSSANLNHAEPSSVEENKIDEIDSSEVVTVSTPIKRLGRPRKSSTIQPLDLKIESADSSSLSKRPTSRSRKTSPHPTELAADQPVDSIENSALENSSVETSKKEIEDSLNASVENGVEEDEDEISLSAQRKSKKRKSKKSSESFEESKVKDEEEESLRKVAATKGRKGRPRKSVQLSEQKETEEKENENETANSETNVQEVREDEIPIESVPESTPKKKLGRPKKVVSEIKVEKMSTEVQEVLPRKKLGRPRKSVQPEVEPDDVIKTEEKPVEEVSVEKLPKVDVDEDLSGKKRIRRPKKNFSESSFSVATNHSAETSFFEQSLEQSDSEENVPLKSKKRKMSSSKSKVDIQPDLVVEIYNVDHVSNDEDLVPVVTEPKKTESSKKRGRPKKQKSSSELNETSENKSIKSENREVVVEKSDQKDDDVFDFKTDEEEEDDNWLSQDRSFRQKLKEKLIRPRQRSSSLSASPRSFEPKPKRERFFSDDTADASESVATIVFEENASHRDVDRLTNDGENNNENDDEKCDDVQENESDDDDDARADESDDQPLVSRGMKRRRSSFANSFYSQAPRRKVLRRTAARLSMQRASESEALMTAIFDDDSLSNQDPKVGQTKPEDEVKVDQTKPEDEVKVDPTKPQEEVKVDPTKTQEEVKVEPVPSAEQEEEQVNPQVEEELQVADKDVTVSKETLPKPEEKEEMSLDEEFARLSEIPDDESFYDSCHRPKRVRRPVQHQVQIEIDTNRVVFPLEVRAFAVDQIRQGATKVQVARDLDCPVSTVSGWWNRRDQIALALSQSLSTESAVELSTTTSTSEKDNVEIPKPKVREQILTSFV